jgi:hypothetical protein
MTYIIFLKEHPLKPRANSLKREPACLQFFDLRRRLEHDYQQDLKISPRRKKSRLLRLVVVRLSGVPQSRRLAQPLEKPRGLFHDLAQVNVFRVNREPARAVGKSDNAAGRVTVLIKFLRIVNASRNCSCSLISGLGRYLLGVRSSQPQSNRRVRWVSNSSSVRIPFTRNWLSRSNWSPTSGSISAVASTGRVSCRGAVVSPPLGSSTIP